MQKVWRDTIYDILKQQLKKCIISIDIIFNELKSKLTYKSEVSKCKLGGNYHGEKIDIEVKSIDKMRLKSINGLICFMIINT